MKKSILAAGLIALVAAVSCDQLGVSEQKQISATVRVSEAQLFGMQKPDHYSVTITNVSTMTSSTADTENGFAVFTDILPGVYDIVALGKGEGYNYIGSKEKVEILTDAEVIEIDITPSKKADLLFKEIYYAGCTTVPATDPDDPWSAVTYFRDQFYEIYNNSEETIYVDGLCIGTTSFATYDFAQRYTYSSIANRDYFVFCRDIFQLPGSGKDYPVAPGESVVIAQWATNHHAEELCGPDHSIDLRSAEFECPITIGAVWGATITDEAAINAKYITAKSWAAPQWLTSCSGDRYIIFRPSQPLLDHDFPVADEDPYNSSAIPVLISDVIDGVESVQDETRLATLGLPAVIDAGCIWVDAPGDYNGESISRKIESTTEDGRVIYQDTNNTTNDFQVNKTPELRRNGAKIPSWNTWAK